MKESKQTCINCKHSFLNHNLKLYCKCVFKNDFTTLKRLYEPCESARYCINCYKYSDKCQFFKKKIIIFEKIKSLFVK